MRIAFVASAIPRRCGIATFTADLVAAVKAADPDVRTVQAAIDEPITARAYGPEVKWRIRQGDEASYRAAGRAIDDSSVDVVNLQHEFGLYGVHRDGTYHDHATALLGELHKPVITTLHTVSAVATVDRIIAAPAEKQALGQQFDALAVEMESAHVARRCTKAEVPFGCLRVVSDTVDTPLSPRLAALLGSGHVSGWRVLTSLMRSLNRVGQAASAAAAAPYLEPVRACSADLVAQVGPPPTERLARTLDVVQRACGHLERAADASEAATAASEGRVGGKLLLRADQMVPPGEVRALPVVAGVSTESHVDPKFSRIASGLAEKHVDVNCWSRVDWTRLLREEKAYTLHHIDDNTLGRVYPAMSAMQVNFHRCRP